jgi:hypothetical protein
MRLIKFSNNAVSRLVAPITNASTIIAMTPGDGAKFPDLAAAGSFFMATLIKADGTTEVVKVTARVSDTLTVVRAAEAVAGVTASAAFNVNDRIEQRLTAGALGNELDRLDAAAVTGAINKSVDYTVTNADVTMLIRVDSTAGTLTITLPAISSLADDFDVTVAKVTGDANVVNVVRSASDTINGAATYALNNQWQSGWFVADRSTGSWTAINIAIGDGSVVTSKLADGAITDIKVAAGAAIQASKLAFNSPKAGSVQRTVSNKVNDIVSVKDFGAVGDGVTNDIAAFVAASAAITNNSMLYIPEGDYVFDFSSFSVASPTYPSQGIINLSGKTGVRIHGYAKLRITNLNTNIKGGWSIISLTDCSDIEVSGLVMDIRGVTGLSTPSVTYPIISCVYAIGLTWQNITIRGCEFTSFHPLGADASASGTLFSYKQIPLFAQGDSASDTVRGLRIVDNVFRSINTYKVFYLGIGGVEITGNEFLDTAGAFPAIRALIHASRGHIIAGNHFEGLKPSDDSPVNSINSTDLPSMVWVTNATNKGGGGVTVVGNTFALTGSGGVVIGDCSGATVADNAFWDRVSMSSVFVVEDDTKSCIRLMDEASGAGSYPARDVSVRGNVATGTLSRKFAQITHSLDTNIVQNVVESARGYAIKAAKSRRCIIAQNTICSVASFVGAQEAIFVNTGTGIVADTEPVTITGNIIYGTAGNAISTSGYTATRLKLFNNQVVGGMVAKVTGVQEQAAIDLLKFGNDATRVSADPATLDWYEEGTFTPTIAGVTVVGTGTYSAQIGHFTRFGDTVSFDITITWTAHSGTGNTEILGLPYVARNTANKIVPLSITQNGGPIPGAGKNRLAIITSNTSKVVLREFDPSTAVIGNANAITATGTLYISGTYRV